VKWENPVEPKGRSFNTCLERAAWKASKTGPAKERKGGGRLCQSQCIAREPKREQGRQQGVEREQERLFAVSLLTPATTSSLPFSCLILAYSRQQPHPHDVRDPDCAEPAQTALRLGRLHSLQGRARVHPSPAPGRGSFRGQVRCLWRDVDHSTTQGQADGQAEDWHRYVSSFVWTGQS
jgi:hypothetical protein